MTLIATVLRKLEKENTACVPVTGSRIPKLQSSTVKEQLEKKPKGDLGFAQ
jgi:cell division protein ZapA (FtsZ GTPase activity inhibitor)